MLLPLCELRPGFAAELVTTGYVAEATKRSNLTIRPWIELAN